MDDEHISRARTKRQNQTQRPIIQTAEALEMIVVDDMVKED